MGVRTPVGARRWGKASWLALVVLLLLAASPFHTCYCQDTRPYSLMFTLFVLAM
jgi:uncharacterized membrane protein